MSKLIIDSGSSKVEWSWIYKTVYTSSFPVGIHPFFLNSWQIANILREQIIPFDVNIKNVQEVYFYGTGINSVSQEEIVKESLYSVFPSAQLFLSDDILAAARSLCQHESGIACILGTGSNACLYKDDQIVYKNSGFGYILGDEGGGSYLGKKVINHFLHGLFPADLLEKFNRQFSTNIETILDSVYRNPFANQYLASFTHFLSRNRGEDIIEEIISNGLNEFFNTRLYYFPQRNELPVHFTGSIAYVFRDVLEKLAANYNIIPGKISKSPMDGLLEFHKDK